MQEAKARFLTRAREESERERLLENANSEGDAVNAVNQVNRDSISTSQTHDEKKYHTIPYTV